MKLMVRYFDLDPLLSQQYDEVSSGPRRNSRAGAVAEQQPLLGSVTRHGYFMPSAAKIASIST